MIRLKKILLTLLMASLAAFVIVGATSTKANAESGSGFINNSGAYVRLSNSYSDTYGIKFTADVGTPIENGEYHMMIIPVTYYEKYEEYVSALGENETAKTVVEWLLDLKAQHSEMPLAIVDATPTVSGKVMASIVSLKWKNLNTSFIGVAYCTVNGELVSVADFEYSEDVIAHHARTLSNVVESFFNDDPEEFYNDNEYTEDQITEINDYLNGLIKNTILQANGVEEADAQSATIDIAFGEHEKTLYIGENATLNYTPAVGKTLAEWTTSDSSVVTVNNGEITAVGGGTASVSASIYGASDSATVNVLPIQFLNAQNISVTGNATSGTIELTRTEAPAQNSRKTATVGFTANYSDAFMEVTFTAGEAGIFENRTTLFESGIHIGLRRANMQSFTTDNLNGWSVDYKNFAKDNMPIALNFNGLISNYYKGLSTGVGQVLYGTSDAINNLTPGATYKIMSGVLGTGDNAYVYFCLKDAADDVKLLIRWNIGEVVSVHNNPNVTGISDSGFFTVHVSRDEATTLNYKIITTVPQEVLSYDAPQITQDGCTLSWNNVPWATEYAYSIDGAEYVKTTENSVVLSSGTHSSFAVKAINGTAEKIVTVNDIICTDDDIVTANMTVTSSTELTYNSGNITFTNSEDVIAVTDSSRMSNKTAYVMIKKSYTEQFIKVGFTPTNVQYARNGLGIHFRGNDTTATPVASASNSGYWSISPWEFGSCLALTCNGQVSDINVAWGNQHKGRLMYGTYNALNSLDTSKTYYALVGVRDGIGDEYIYFGLEDENENLLVLIRWAQSEIVNAGVSASAYFTNLAENGFFVIKSWAANGRSLTWEVIEDATDILSSADKITLSQNGCTVSWNKVGWAEKYAYSVDGSAYVETTENSFNLSAYGIYSVDVKAISGTTETIGSTTVTYTPSSITLTNMTYADIIGNSASGNITFEGNSAVGSGRTTAVTSFANVGDEFVEVTFTSKSTNMNGNKLFIGLRQNSIASNDFWLGWNIWFPTWSPYISIDHGTTNKYADIGTVLYGSTSDLTKMTIGAKYTMFAGILGTGDNADVYFGLNDANGNLLFLIMWNIGVVKTSMNKPTATLNDTGYINIYSLTPAGETVEFGYNITSDSLNSFGYLNMQNVTKTQNTDGTYSLTFTPAAGVATGTGSNSSNASSVIFTDKQGENVFVQVKFTAVDTDISKNGIAIGYRSPSLSNNVDATRRLRFGSSWAYSYSMPGDKQNYGKNRDGNGNITGDNHTNLVKGGATGLTVGKDYIITFGMHTDYNGTPDDTSDDTRILYMFISLVDNGVETLRFAKTFNWIDITNGSPTYLTEGYIQVFSWYAGERTLTVGLTDYDTVNTKYISQISG